MRQKMIRAIPEEREGGVSPYDKFDRLMKRLLAVPKRRPVLAKKPTRGRKKESR